MNWLMARDRKPRDSDSTLVRFEGFVRERCLSPFGDDVAARQIAAMVQAASQENEDMVTHRIPVRVRRLALATAAAIFGTTALSTGLAHAGVITLPEPARAVLSSLGVPVPDRVIATDDDETTAEGEESVERPDKPETPAAGQPTDRPVSTPSGQPANPPRDSAELPDDADERASERGDNANGRASEGSDNASDPGSQADQRGDNADPRAGAGGDNANERGADGADSAP